MSDGELTEVDREELRNRLGERAFELYAMNAPVRASETREAAAAAVRAAAEQLADGALGAPAPVLRAPGVLDALRTLTEAIERHRDEKYEGAIVTDRLDARLYEAAVWVRDNEQELGLA